MVGGSSLLDPGTVEVLKAQAARQLEEQREWDGASSDSGYVFTKEDGTAYHPEVVSRFFRQAVKRALLPEIRLHDLRHTHATLALRAGIHPKVVSERLGHATVSITLDTYSHAIPAMQEEAAALIAELVFAAETEPMRSRLPLDSFDELAARLAADRRVTPALCRTASRPPRTR